VSEEVFGFSDHDQLFNAQLRTHPDDSEEEDESGRQRAQMQVSQHQPFTLTCTHSPLCSHPRAQGSLERILWSKGGSLVAVLSLSCVPRPSGFPSALALLSEV
jgi:hypothetical protein